MAQISLKDLISFTQSGGSTLSKVPGWGSGDFLKNLNETIRNIQSLLKAVQETQGLIGFRFNDTNMQRAAGPESIQSKVPPQSLQPGQDLNSRLKGILAVISQALSVMESQGKGDESIGKIISELPFKVSDVNNFVKTAISKL